MDVDTMPGAPLDCMTTLYEYGGEKARVLRTTMLSLFLLSTIDRPLALENLSWFALPASSLKAVFSLAARSARIRSRDGALVVVKSCAMMIGFSKGQCEHSR